VILLSGPGTIRMSRMARSGRRHAPSPSMIRSLAFALLFGDGRGSFGSGPGILFGTRASFKILPCSIIGWFGWHADSSRIAAPFGQHLTHSSSPPILRVGWPVMVEPRTHAACMPWPRPSVCRLICPEPFAFRLRTVLIFTLGHSFPLTSKPIYTPRRFVRPLRARPALRFLRRLTQPCSRKQQSRPAEKSLPSNSLDRARGGSKIAFASLTICPRRPSAGLVTPGGAGR
jgi:hypothetical protein